MSRMLAQRIIGAATAHGSTKPFHITAGGFLQRSSRPLALEIQNHHSTLSDIAGSKGLYFLSWAPKTGAQRRCMSTNPGLPPGSEFMSDSGVASSGATPTDFLPDSSLIDPSTTQNISGPSDHAMVGASLDSYFATEVAATEVLTGLESIGYAPSEIVMRTVEMLHVGAGLPYWGAIVALTLALRTATLPIHVSSMRNAAKMAIIRPEMEAMTKKMQQLQDPTSEEQMLMAQEMQALLNKHDVHPFKNLIYPFLQLPLFVSVFFGLKEMGTHFPGLATGGLGPVLDLTAADPTFVLPVVTGALFLGMVELGGGADMPQTPTTRQLKWFMRAMAVATPVMTYQFPAGVFVYWMTSNAFTLMQSVALKNPTIKAALDIPEIPESIKNPPEKNPDMHGNFLYKKQMETVARQSKLKHDVLKRAVEISKEKQGRSRGKEKR
mmetsp:Transcript_20051/g.31534  ORF Transcript_20051/g.31534 Transcript_20051/m.31534 type:complete len:437 (-) Transcript_20051:333-1643(-)